MRIRAHFSKPNRGLQVKKFGIHCSTITLAANVIFEVMMVWADAM